MTRLVGSEMCIRDRYLVSTEETNKYFKSMGYIVVGLSVLGITFLKRKQLKENGENI
jgi:hypothetical protein